MPTSRTTRVTAETGRELWHERVARTPAAPFLIGGGRTRTFAEADVEMRRLASGFAGAGVGLGTRVLVGLPNAAETVLVHAALRELGAVIVPLLTGLTFTELAFQIRHSEAPILIADEAMAAAVVPHLDECPAVRTVITAAELAEMDRCEPLAPAPLPGLDARSPWAILYTSGSSGTPKGVVLPAGCLVTAGAGYVERFGIGAEDNYFLPLTMAHAVGALTAQGVSLTTGCRLTVVDRFSPSRFWQDIRDSGATCSILFPAQLNLLLEHTEPDPAGTSLRLAITHAWSEPFRQKFGVELGLCWGMTETGAHSTGTRVDYRDEHGEGYVGPAMQGVEIAILGPDGEHLGPGETGQIALRHPNVMLEYLKEPEQTAATLVDGWIMSGDLGTVDADGGLFFAGRKKNMIKRSGENVSPAEIETALCDHPDVIEALVFGVADPIRTEEIAATVTIRAGAGLDPEALTAFLRERLARWKLPRYLSLTDESLPRLANGKIDRVAVVGALDPETCWDRERRPASNPKEGARA
jgi:crotonobetaine/carnitine-CoA ligase